MDAKGPGRFFTAHPDLYAIALVGAASAGVLFAIRAVRSSGARRLGWIALAALQILQIAGIKNAKAGGFDRG